MTVQGISHNGVKLVGWAALPLPLATVAVFLRFKSRRLMKQIGLDDWCMLYALIVWYGLYTVCVVWAVKGWVGHPQKDLSYAQIQDFLKLFWCVQFFYAQVGPPIKLSFLLLYRRIFTVRWFLHTINVVAGLVIIWWISTTLSVVFSCWPVGSYWQPLLQEHCIDSQKFWWANGISNLLIDVIILCLPMPMIWRLQLSLQRKISLSAIFALGAFICTASILRVTSLWYINFENVSGTVVPASIWTSIEPGIGIVCGCLPTLPLLFRHWHEQHFSSHSRRLGGLLRFRSSSRRSDQSNGSRSPTRDLETATKSSFVSVRQHGAQRIRPGTIHVCNEYSVSYQQD